MAFRRSRQPAKPRSLLRRVFDLMLTAALFAILALVVARLEQFSIRKQDGVPSVADGDTLVLNGNRLRLEGIDAPEFMQSCQGVGGNYACGKQARSFMVKLIGGRPVACEGWQPDKYGRLLVHCTAGSTQLNREMVAQGWAVAYGDYDLEEAEARDARRGIWQGQFERPSIYRKIKGDLVEPQETPHDLWFKLRQILATLLKWSA